MHSLINPRIGQFPALAQKGKSILADQLQHPTVPALAKLEGHVLTHPQRGSSGREGRKADASQQ
jgi:hypothetical protein